MVSTSWCFTTIGFSDERRIMLDVVEAVAAEVFIPLSVGGGVRTVADATDLRLAGAKDQRKLGGGAAPGKLIDECAHALGNQNVVLSMDVLRVGASPAVPRAMKLSLTRRLRTGQDALAWALEGVKQGAGELVVNSIDADGTRDGLWRAHLDSAPQRGRTRSGDRIRGRGHSGPSCGSADGRGGGCGAWWPPWCTSGITAVPNLSNRSPMPGSPMRMRW